MAPEERILPEHEAFFPNLLASGYRKTSNEDEAYNCICWSLGNKDKVWTPIPGGYGYYWPENFPRTVSISNFVRLYRELGGFEICDSIDLEAGHDKIAIYGIGADFSHVARQLPSGKWTSKLGDFEDIEHDSIQALESQIYGEFKVVMKRVSLAVNSPLPSPSQS